MLKYITIGILILFMNNIGSSQALSCDEAELLTSIDELDGIQGFMPVDNPNDEPAPFCPGSSDGTGNPQNMTWFSFIANNTEATLEITFSNCNNGNRIQYGMYTDCSFNEYHFGVCQGDAVLVTDPVIVHMSDMIVGEDYYFFIDGDIGTYCDYIIEVTCIGGLANIPQPTGLECISVNCPNEGVICNIGETLTFEPEGLDLPIDYIWTITPSSSNDTTISNDNKFTATFEEVGVYEVCVVGNNGCSETEPVCYSFNIVIPDAGDIILDSDTLCIGETTVASTTDFFVGNLMVISMIAVDPDGTVINADYGSTLDVTFDEIGIVKVFSYNFNPSISPDFPYIGESFIIPDCDDFCCGLDSIDLVFVDNKITSVSNNFVDNSPDIQIYPNPTKRVLKVDIRNTNSSIIKLKIMDIQGRIFMTHSYHVDPQRLIDLNLSDLPNGFYQLVINFGDNFINKKFVKID